MAQNISKDTAKTLDVVPRDEDEWFSPMCIPIAAENPQHQKKARDGVLLVIDPDDVELTTEDRSTSASVGVYDPVDDGVAYDIIDFSMWRSVLTDDADFPPGARFVFTDQHTDEMYLNGITLNGVVTNEWQGSISASIVKTTTVDEHYKIDVREWPRDVFNAVDAFNTQED